MKIGLYAVLAYVAVVYLLPMLGGGSGGGSGSLGGGAGTTMGSGGAVFSDKSKPLTITEKIENTVSQTGGSRGYPQYEKMLDLTPGTYKSTGVSTYSGRRGGSEVEGNWPAGNQLNKATNQRYTQISDSERLYTEKSRIWGVSNTLAEAQAWNTTTPSAGQESAGGGKNGMAQNAPAPIPTNQWNESGGGTYPAGSTQGKGGIID